MIQKNHPLFSTPFWVVEEAKLFAREPGLVVFYQLFSRNGLRVPAYNGNVFMVTVTLLRVHWFMKLVLKFMKTLQTKQLNLIYRITGTQDFVLAAQAPSYFDHPISTSFS